MQLSEEYAWGFILLLIGREVSSKASNDPGHLVMSSINRTHFIYFTITHA